MSFFSKQAFDDDDDSDIDCELPSNNNWDLQLNDNNNNIDIDIIPQQHHQNIINNDININKSINNTISHTNNNQHSNHIKSIINTDNTNQHIQSNQNSINSSSNVVHFNNDMNEDDTDDDIAFDSSDSNDDQPIVSSNINDIDRKNVDITMAPIKTNNIPLVFHNTNTMNTSTNILAPKIKVENTIKQSRQTKIKQRMKLPIKIKQRMKLPMKLHKNQKPLKSPEKKIDNLQFVIPANHHLKIQMNKSKNKNNKNNKCRGKKYRNNNKNKSFGYHNVQNNWKMKAGIVSTKVINKQSPPAHPKSNLNIQERTKYVALRRKKIIVRETLDEIEEKEYNELKMKVENEQNTFKKWLFAFYKSKDQKYADYKELTHFAQQNQEEFKKYKINLNELVNASKFNHLAYYYINQYTVKHIVNIINTKKQNLINNYSDKYGVDVCGKEMDEICGINKGERNGECDWIQESTLEFLANLNENNGKIPQWTVPKKYFNRKYNDQILMDMLPSQIDIYADGESNINNKKNDITQHVIYKESVRVSKDNIIHETLLNNLNSKDINVVLSDEIMSLLIDIDENNKWRKSFMIPFIIKPNPNKNGNNNILYMDKQCLDQNWKRRYCNHTYFKHVFRSYLAQNFMKDNMEKYEQYLQQNNNNNNIFEDMLSKQNEWNELMCSYSKNPHFVYSMWRLNELHLLIRTKTYGQLIYNTNNKYNCYSTVKLDYLNQHKQIFITHHNMKSKSKDEFKKNNLSLRDCERSLYGIERLIDSERMRLFIQNELRPNNKLIIGRIQIPSRKLLTINVIDYKTLLNDESEHIYLQNRCKNALFLMDKLFKYLVNEIEYDINKQYLLAYDSNSDLINIFSEINEEKKTNDSSQLFSYHGYINGMCGIILNNNINIEMDGYISPYSLIYRGLRMNNKCHIPNISPPTNCELPKPCQMFLFHGLCPKQQLQQDNIHNNIHNNNNENDICEYAHYRTHIINHCWEYALYGGHCERGINCEWPHLKQEELINKGYEMFHVRQLINYCQDYYKKSTCKNLQNGANCNFVHFNQKQLIQEFNTKYKNKQMRKEQLIQKAKILQKHLKLVQNQKLPAQTIRGKKKIKRKKNSKKIQYNHNQNI